MSWPLRASLLVALVVGLLVLVAACSSLDKATLGERLRALPKNARMADQELLQLTLQVDGESVEMVALDTGPTPGDRRAVLLVHGTPAALFDWTELSFGSEAVPSGLAARRRVLAPDLPGHGLTRTARDEFDFATLAAALVSFLRERTDEPVHLVGHSYGGEVALRAALDHPELFASLTLMDSAGLSRRDDEWLPEEEAMRDLPGAGFGWLLNSREKVRGALQVHFAEPVDDDLAEEMFLVLENAQNWGAMVDLARDENGDREADLASMRVPTLLLWGADDIAYTVDRFARRFEDGIPGARLQLLEGVGHYPHHEQPAQTLAALEAFFGAHDAD